MLLNRKYINDIVRELEKAQGINEHCCLEVRNMELPNCERECEYYRRGLQVNPIIYEEVKRNENR